MTLLVASAAVAAILSWSLVGLLRSYALGRGIFLTKPRPRDLHRRPTPRVGGLAIMITFLLVLATIWLVLPERLVFSSQTLWQIDKNLLGLVLALILLSGVNLRDDFKGIHWGWKLAAQIAAAMLVAYFGIKIQTISNPFGEPFVLGRLDWLFVVAWLVLLGNAVNWLDSLNGLAGGVSAISIAVLVVLSLSDSVNQLPNALVGAIAFGAIIGFLVHNFFGRVFLGDVGSIMLGFLIGVLAIISGGKVATAFLVMAIPILDSIVVIVSRLVGGASPFQADSRHLAQRLLLLGWKKWQINLFIYLMSLSLGLVALNTQTIGKFWAITLSIIIMLALVAFYSFAPRAKGGTMKRT